MWIPSEPAHSAVGWTLWVLQMGAAGQLYATWDQGGTRAEEEAVLLDCLPFSVMQCWS